MASAILPARLLQRINPCKKKRMEKDDENHYNDL